MDKKSGIGLLLITLLVFAWMIYVSTNQEPVKNEQTQQTKSSNTQVQKNTSSEPQNSNIIGDSARFIQKFGSTFAPFAYGNEEFVTIKTDLYTAKISSKGAVVKSWKLTKFNKWDGTKVQLINDKMGELSMFFSSMEGKRIDSRHLFFKFDKPASEITIKGSEKYSFNAIIDLGNGKSIVKTFVFEGNSYHLDQNIQINNLDNIIPSRGYNFVWNKGIAYQEYSSVDESNDAVAHVSMNDASEELNADKDEPVESSYTGIVDYAAIRTKYFTASIIPQPWKRFDGTVDINGYRNHYPNSGIIETYGISFRVPYKGGVQKNDFRVYLGPLDYDIVSDYGMHKLVNFGWAIFRPIGEYLLLPLFRMVYKFVHNYGIAILLFSLLIKILLHPLSVQQLRSSQKMQLLTPELTKIREKYKDDQATQQKETMKLYSEYGINPAGGCLPLVLQMPIMFSLWAVLKAAIELRQEGFIWWITDLSMPDVIVDFGFSILGITHLSGLALLMGVTMFIQQKMTITDPRQKALVYMMPIMFVFMFSNFPSGLNLYYFFFNLLSIGQQYYMNNFSKKRMTLEEMKRAPKKESWLQKKLQQAQEVAESQGRSIPGSRNTNNNSNTKRPNQRKK